MDTIKIIEKLAKMARNESLPQFDVSGSVLREISILQNQKAGIVPLEFFTAAAAAAASIIIFLSVHAWQSIVNPLIQLVMPLQETPLW